MTEKRFELIELYGDDHLIDNETNEKIGYDLHSPSTFNANWNNVCNLLNELHEERNYFERKKEEFLSKWSIANTENIQLRQENEQLKQFKEDVFAKIDMHLRMLPTVRDNVFNEEYGDPSLYTGAIYMLETLKKELLK